MLNAFIIHPMRATRAVNPTVLERSTNYEVPHM